MIKPVFHSFSIFFQLFFFIAFAHISPFFFIDFSSLFLLLLLFPWLFFYFFVFLSSVIISNVNLMTFFVHLYFQTACAIISLSPIYILFTSSIQVSVTVLSTVRISLSLKTFRMTKCVIGHRMHQTPFYVFLEIVSLYLSPVLSFISYFAKELTQVFKFNQNFVKLNYVFNSITAKVFNSL